MEIKEFDKWLEAKSITAEVLATKSADEQVSLFNDYNSEVRKSIVEAVESKASKEDIDNLKTLYSENLVKQLDTINGAIKEQGIVIKKLSTQEIEQRSMSFTDQVRKNLTASLDNLKGLNKNANKEGAKSSEFSFKVAGDMTTIGNVTGQVPVEQRESGVNNIARRRTFIRGLINNGIASSTLISWVEQQNPDGSPAGTVEGTLKNQIDFDLVVVNESVKKRTAFIKVSDEMIDDIDFMVSEINNELSERLNLDVDGQLLLGDNIGQNLNGIVTQATAYAAGIFALTVDNANLVDVLVTAIDQIDAANFSATSIVLNGRDLTTLKLLKVSASDDRYIDRLMNVAGQMSLDGIPIVTNNGMTQGKFLVMDGSKATVFTKAEMSIEFGMDSDDFTKNMRTVRAEWRGLIRIKGNDKPAFVYGDIAAAKAALETI